MRFENWPLYLRYGDHRNEAIGYVLLVCKIAVARKEHFDSTRLGSRYQEAVAQTLPTHIGRSHNLMINQGGPQPMRKVFVQ